MGKNILSFDILLSTSIVLGLFFVECGSYDWGVLIGLIILLFYVILISLEGEIY